MCNLRGDSFKRKVLEMDLRMVKIDELTTKYGILDKVLLNSWQNNNERTNTKQWEDTITVKVHNKEHITIVINAVVTLYMSFE